MVDNSVKVLSRSGQGSGGVYALDGQQYIITNAHVVGDRERIYGHLYNDAYYYVIESENDWALARLSSKIQSQCTRLHGLLGFIEMSALGFQDAAILEMMPPEDNQELYADFVAANPAFIWDDSEGIAPVSAFPQFYEVRDTLRKLNSIFEETTDASSESMPSFLNGSYNITGYPYGDKTTVSGEFRQLGSFFPGGAQESRIKPGISGSTMMLVTSEVPFGNDVPLVGSNNELIGNDIPLNGSNDDLIGNGLSTEVFDPRSFVAVNSPLRDVPEGLRENTVLLNQPMRFASVEFLPNDVAFGAEIPLAIVSMDGYGIAPNLAVPIYPVLQEILEIEAKRDEGILTIVTPTTQKCTENSTQWHRMEIDMQTGDSVNFPAVPNLTPALRTR